MAKNPSRLKKKGRQIVAYRRMRDELGFKQLELAELRADFDAADRACARQIARLGRQVMDLQSQLEYMRGDSAPMQLPPGVYDARSVEG
jgi:hypothetical protein